VPKCISRRTTNEIEEDAMSFCVHVAAGAYHCAALTLKGGLYTWGLESNGRLGHGKPGDPGYTNPKTKYERNNNAPMKVRKRISGRRTIEETVTVDG
jgi:alpha-tubulin suppressor-like RCC1 family protein